MKGWKEYRFGELVDFPPRVALRKGEEYPFIEMEVVNPSNRHVGNAEHRKYESSSCSKFAHGDVLLARITPCLENGKIAQARLEDTKVGFGSTEFFVFRAKPDLLDQSFLFYLTKCDLIWKSAVNSMVGASGRQRADAKFLKRVLLEIPGLPTQRKIAAILAAYDDLIENNRRRIALLEKMAEELYREWFVRMRFPGHEQVKKVKGVPEGWDFDKASVFFGLVKGKSYAGEELSEDPEHMPFINLKSFNRGGGYREDGLKYYSGRYKPEQVVHQNDVVMAVTDMTQDRAIVGQVARVPDLGERGAVISLDTVKLVPKKISRTFLYAYMRHSGFANYIKEFANGANVLHLKPELITHQKIVVPSKELQDQFTPVAEPLYAQADMLGEANSQLVKIRDSLLSRLISGKLSVENLDIKFPPSMVEELATAHA